ncbi:MAG TPA: aspartate kinase [Methanomassiliicoccales archaeon]|nr:aspartate kinase [Methanomassiliicoccales archaeon]
MKVMKFGGSSLKSGEGMRRVCKIISSDGELKVVVVSALSGVTEELIQFMSQLRKEDEIETFIKGMEDKHIALLAESVDNDTIKKEACAKIKDKLVRLERALYGFVYLEELTPRTKDIIQSLGERLSVVLVAATLQDMGVKAVPIDADDLGIITDGLYGGASAILDATAKNICPRLRQMFDRGETPVVTGFFGRTVDGHVTIFGRNGSDYSAAVVANALNADALEIWKDVDGFMSVDPKIVKEAVPIDSLSYDEAAELSYFGAQVLHPRTVEPARMKNITIFVKNVFRPELRGTAIKPSGVQKVQGIKSISFMKNMSIIKIYGAGAGTKTGVISEISSKLTDAGVNIYSAATSQTCVAFLIAKPDLHMAQRTLETSKKGVIERIETTDDVALLCVVGEGLGYEKGIAARVFTAVAKEGVSVNMISAGASLVAYHFTVDKKDLERTTRAIHVEFFHKAA